MKTQNPISTHRSVPMALLIKALLWRTFKLALALGLTVAASLALAENSSRNLSPQGSPHHGDDTLRFELGNLFRAHVLPP